MKVEFLTESNIILDISCVDDIVRAVPDIVDMENKVTKKTLHDLSLLYKEFTDSNIRPKIIVCKDCIVLVGVVRFRKYIYFRAVMYGSHYNALMYGKEIFGDSVENNEENAKKLKRSLAVGAKVLSRCRDAKDVVSVMECMRDGETSWRPTP